jgi:hypothetical protein
MDLLFVCAKPSSSRLKNASLVEIAGVRTNGQIGTIGKSSIRAAFTSKIRLQGEEQSEHSPFIEVLRQFKLRLLDSYEDRYAVVAYHSDILRPILRNECARAGETEELFAGRAWLDISILAWPMADSGLISLRSVEALANHFGVPLESTDPPDVCTAMVSVYGRMMRRYRTALTGESMLREVGGETLEGIRKIVGF